KSTETTFEAAAIRASSSPAFTSRRLRPTSPPSARSTSARASGEPPTTTTRRTAKTDVSRAAAYAPAATTASRTPTSTDLNDGRSLRSEGTPLRTGKATARELALLRSPTGPDSPRRPDPLQGRQLERAEEAHLVLELDAEAARDAGAGFGHQRDRVGRRRLAGVLDEVGVSVRDPRPADLEALETALLDGVARPERGARVLEDAPERALVRRLGRFPPCEELGHLGPDRGRVAHLEVEACFGDDVAGPEVRMPVVELELVGAEPPPAGGRYDERLGEQGAELAAERAGIHA